MKAESRRQKRCIRGIQPIQKDGIVEHYEDTYFLMQLRMFCEAIYSRALGGADSRVKRAALMEGSEQSYKALEMDLIHSFSQQLIIACYFLLYLSRGVTIKAYKITLTR